MATKSFTNEQKFNKKGATSLLKALTIAESKSSKLNPPHKVTHLKRNSSTVLKSFLYNVKV